MERRTTTDNCTSTYAAPYVLVHMQRHTPTDICTSSYGAVCDVCDLHVYVLVHMERHTPTDMQRARPHPYVVVRGQVCVRIRQHTSAYVSIRHTPTDMLRARPHPYVVVLRLRPHTLVAEGLIY